MHCPSNSSFSDFWCLLITHWLVFPILMSSSGFVNVFRHAAVTWPGVLSGSGPDNHSPGLCSVTTASFSSLTTIESVGTDSFELYQSITIGFNHFGSNWVFFLSHSKGFMTSEILSPLRHTLGNFVVTISCPRMWVHQQTDTALTWTC